MNFERAVEYEYNHYGLVVGVTLKKGWTPASPLLHRFPLHARQHLRPSNDFKYTPMEQLKLLAGENVSLDATAAVIDDILCSRAARNMVRHEEFHRARADQLKQQYQPYKAWLAPEPKVRLRQLRSRTHEQDQEQGQ